MAPLQAKDQAKHGPLAPAPHQLVIQLNHDTIRKLYKGFLVRKLITLLLFLISCQALPAYAATHYFQSWTSLKWVGDIKESKFHYFLNAQARLIAADPTFNQAVFRAGLAYNLTSRTSLWLGYDYVPTQPVGKHTFRYEHRSWQALLWRAPKRKYIIPTLRTRLEQRYLIGNPGVALRLRQKIAITFAPILRIAPKDATPVIWDELFFNLNHPSWITKNTIDQNRVFLGYSIPIAKRIIFIIGYLNQYKIRNPKNIMNHILYASFVFFQG